MFKKIGKFIKRGLKSVGKFLKRGFKKISGFMGRLGPVGMLGMMILMPQMSSWWKSFGDWAGALEGPLGKVMSGFHEAGKFVGEAYSSVTETITNQIKKIPGVGEAYEGLEGWVNEKLDTVRGALGVEQSAMAPASSETVQKVDDEIFSQTRTQAPQDRTNIFGGDTQLNPDGTLKLDSMDQYRSLMSDPRQSGIMDQGKGDLFGQSPGEEWYSGKNTGGTNFVEDTSGVVADAKSKITGEETWIDKAKEIYGGVSAVKGTIDELFGDDEEAVTGGTYIADNMIPIMSSHESAKLDFTNQNFAGTPQFGIGDSNYVWSLLRNYEANTAPFQLPAVVRPS